MKRSTLRAETYDDHRKYNTLTAFEWFFRAERED